MGYISASYTTPKEAAVREFKKGEVEKIRMGVPATRPELLKIARSLCLKEAMTLVGMSK